jgi:hypothetical protein
MLESLSLVVTMAGTGLVETGRSVAQVDFAAFDTMACDRSISDRAGYPNERPGSAVAHHLHDREVSFATRQARWAQTVTPPMR